MLATDFSAPVSYVRGQRRCGEDRLVYEASSVIRAACRRQPRWRAAGGFFFPTPFLVDHLDDDVDLVQRVMVSADCLPRGNEWVWGRGVHPITRVVSYAELGDLLVGIVNTHRPV